MTKKRLFTLLRLAVFAGAVAFVLSQIHFSDRVVPQPDGGPVTEPGLISLFSRLHVGWIALTFLGYFAFASAGILRWWFLLRSQRIGLSFPETFRLGWIGLFFNNVVPAPSGGDLIKAVYVARRVPEARARALTTIFLDRLLGLLAAVVIGCTAALTHLGHPGFRDAARLLIGLLIVIALLAAPVFFTSVRHALRLDVLLGRLPFQRALHEVDGAFQLYRQRPRPLVLIFLFTLVVRAIAFVAAWFAARALDLDLSFIHLLIILPVIQVFLLVPVSPGAWGVAEGLYVYFFRFVHLGASSAAAYSILMRLVFMLLSLIGGLFLLVESEEIRAARRAAAEEGRPRANGS